MSDLIGGSSGNGRVTNGGSRAAAAGSVPVSEGRPGAAIRTPRDIMNDRQAREARRRAEADAARAAEEERHNQLRQQQEDERRRKSAEERALAAGVGAQSRVPTAQRGGGAGAGGRQQGESSASTAAPQATFGGQVNAPQPSSRPQDPSAGYSRPRASSQSQGTPRTAPAPAVASTGAQRIPPQSARAPPQPRQPAAPASSSQARPAPSAAASTPQATAASQAAEPSQPRQSSFPHAFERWETLSSHWEGLTSYWIRRLEQYMDDNPNEPLVQQMSRQITDLSAAGANLFHAVVELQRLRASSERKFQRWFFETRQEQERFQEVRMELSRQIDAERQAREEAAQRAARADREKKTNERLLTEMRRELQIAKDEARRAWEELGRREQEERERTISLRDGQPTLVGGVQVVPMQAMISGHGSSAQRPGTRETLPEEEEPLEHGYSYEGGQSPTDTDPFTERKGGSGLRHEPDVSALPRAAHPGTPTTSSTSRTTIPATDPTPAPLRPHQTPASSPAAAPATTATTEPPPEHFYTHAGAYLHGQGQPHGQPELTQQSEVGSYVQSVEASTEASDDEEYEIDAHGNYVLDAQGRPVRYSHRRHSVDSDGDSYDVRAELAREHELAQAYGVGGTSAAGPSGSYGGVYAPPPPPPPADYSGSGYGDSWSGGVPRHYHPSRLSDVLEEDERSRTSPSRTSQVSRNY